MAGKRFSLKPCSRFSVMVKCGAAAPPVAVAIQMRGQLAVGAVVLGRTQELVVSGLFLMGLRTVPPGLRKPVGSVAPHPPGQAVGMAVVRGSPDLQEVAASFLVARPERRSTA
jgi:hypothetical protein